MSFAAISSSLNVTSPTSEICASGTTMRTFLIPSVISNTHALCGGVADVPFTVSFAPANAPAGVATTFDAP